MLSALPGLALMAAGYFHPERLDEGTAHRWWTLHVPGMWSSRSWGVALMWLFKGRRDPLAVVAVLAAFVYAIFYNALDILSGIGAGWVTSRLPSGAARPDEVRSIFAIGTPLGEIGSWGLLVAAVVVALDALLRHRWRACPGCCSCPARCCCTSTTSTGRRAPWASDWSAWRPAGWRTSADGPGRDVNSSGMKINVI